MFKIFKFFIRKKEMRVIPLDTFNIKFKISFPLKDGSYRETSLIRIEVPADSPGLAKRKLIKHVMSKVKVVISQIEIVTSPNANLPKKPVERIKDKYNQSGSDSPHDFMEFYKKLFNKFM